jgi:hypothetical protein
MKLIPRFLTRLLLVTCALTGCQTLPTRAPVASGVAQATRNNCYSLLHQLLNDEKNVSLLLIIKWEQDDVETLIKKISANAATGAKLLEEFARHDPSIRLDDFRLPPGEVAAREAIAATKKAELLDQSGKTFELSLLSTQTQALGYGWHLAKVASENDPQPDRARALAGLSEDVKHLYQEVFALLLSRNK